ncbi:unnamed protein product [Xylocopa violacea]|uniref:Uncharacterized protein n=1 Tax=Xylocopa violacea TaxID=135666 RepID=A0ABP1PEJ8_XYLVO
MNGGNISVKICETDKCIYESNNIIKLNANNLTDLITYLKGTQIEINDFLTSLVDKEDSLVDAKSKWKNRLTSESDSDFEAEIEVNPKKSKLTN